MYHKPIWNLTQKSVTMWLDDYAPTQSDGTGQ
jgi:hypothetical protein